MGCVCVCLCVCVHVRVCEVFKWKKSRKHLDPWIWGSEVCRVSWRDPKFIDGNFHREDTQLGLSAKEQRR